MKIDREQKAERTPPPPSKAVAMDPNESTKTQDGAADITDRNGDAALAPAMLSSRIRSRSRHSTVTDRGQINKSEEDLEKLSREFSRVAPPSSGLAEATMIAPERSHSGLPPQMTVPAEIPGVETLGIIVSDEPTSPPTIVPETDGTSTRPSKGGIAYPFSLKVDGQGHRANASTVTLQSVQIMTPPAVEENKQLFDDTVLTPAAVHESKQLGDALATPHIAADPILPSNKQYFDAPGAGLFSGQWVPATPATEAETPALERPGVERFETAQENLSTLTNADNKA